MDELNEQNEQSQQLALNESQAKQIADIVAQAVGAVTAKYNEAFEAMAKASHGKTPTQEELMAEAQAKINERLASVIVRNNPDMAGVDFEGVSTDVMRYIAGQHQEDGKKLF